MGSVTVDRIIKHITEHGPKSADQLAAALHVRGDSIRRVLSAPVREGVLELREVNKPHYHQPVREYGFPHVRPKYDPQDPFGLVAKLRAERKLGAA